jgi:hypothetical protein
MVDAQIFDNKATIYMPLVQQVALSRLSQQLAKFFVGVNDPLGQNPAGLPFNPNIFDLYKPLLGVSRHA